MSGCGRPPISDNVVQTRLEKLLLHEGDLLVVSAHPAEHLLALELEVLVVVFDNFDIKVKQCCAIFRERPLSRPVD